VGLETQDGEGEDEIQLVTRPTGDYRHRAASRLPCGKDSSTHVPRYLAAKTSVVMPRHD
jgi:hypothetical protein